MKALRLLLLTSVAFALQAETTVKEYKDAMAIPISATAMWVYVTGLGEGMVWANDEATSKGAPLFCQPDDIALGPEDYRNIIDEQIKAASKRMPEDEIDKSFLGLVLMSGLKARFPCSK